MFTGIIEAVGTVASIQKSGSYQKIAISCLSIMGDLSVGDSVAVNGVCQTVSSLGVSTFEVETLQASLEKTTLGSLAVNSSVNIERAMRPKDRFGGHFVQGHVEGTGTVKQIKKENENVFLTIGLPPDLLRYCIPQGSIAVDGVSLTISGMVKGGDSSVGPGPGPGYGTQGPDSQGNITLNIIPTTWKYTTFSELKTGDKVNIETDMLGRYVAHFLSASVSASATASAGEDTGSITVDKLKQWGYMNE